MIYIVINNTSPPTCDVNVYGSHSNDFCGSIMQVQHTAIVSQYLQANNKDDNTVASFQDFQQTLSERSKTVGQDSVPNVPKQYYSRQKTYLKNKLLGSPEEDWGATVDFLLNELEQHPEIAILKNLNGKTLSQILAHGAQIISVKESFRY